MNIPENFICPISQDIMKNPVITPDGISYERDFIVQWLNIHNTDPISKMPLRVNQLVPNLALKSMIEEFVLHNGNVHTPAPNVLSSHNSTINYNVIVTPIIKSFETTTIVTLQTSASFTRLPVHILAVVDVSGSMDEEVEIKTANGVEKNGLSKLDVTKHALKTIINSLTGNDYMTLITFSTTAKLICEFIKVDTAGKSLLLSKTNNIATEGNTNIWDGLVTALNCIERCANSNKSTSIFLLTDGVPNMSPPRGHERELTDKIQQMTQKFTLNTFGFGYQLDSTLLKNLATIGDGLYSFIPDAGFVGTVFINALANQLLTCLVNPHVIITYLDNSSSIHKLNSCKLGINRSVFVKKTKQISKISVCYTNAITQEYYSTEFVPSDVYNEDEYNVINTITTSSNNTFYTLQSDDYVEEILSEGIRNDIIKLIEKLVLFGVSSQSNNEINTFLANYVDHVINDYIRNVIEDVTGQIRIATSDQSHFNKWGKHYLLSLMMSHLLQNCSNFKDPGLQFYTNNLLENIRSTLNTIFNTLPAPQTSIRSSYSRSYGSSTFTSPPTNMSSYNDSSAPCFSGNCTVMTENGNVYVKNVQIGDKILSCFGNFVTVTHILKTSQYLPTFVMQFSEDSFISLKHPVLENGEWKYPKDCKHMELKQESCDLYDFVLESDHIIKLNGVLECITLGHNYVNNEIIEHDYLGSKKVIEDIERIGLAQNTPCVAHIYPKNVIRTESGHIISFSI